jgi:hypothetical protein
VVVLGNIASFIAHLKTCGKLALMGKVKGEGKSQTHK